MRANPPEAEFQVNISKLIINFHRCLLLSSIKREIRHFHVVIVQKRQRSVKKKVCCVCQVFFCLLNSASLDPKVPIVLPRKGEPKC